MLTLMPEPTVAVLGALTAKDVAGPGLTVSVQDCVAVNPVAEVFVTKTVNVNVPSEVVAPFKTPVLKRVSPIGSVPDAKAKLEEPVAVGSILALYPSPAVALGNVAGLRIRFSMPSL
jgi:hypothetical protein